MSQIGPKTIQECTDHLGALLQTYEERLNQAYRKAGGDALDIKLTLKIKPTSTGNGVVAGISFVVEKEQDTSTFSVDEEQLGLGFQEGRA
jgi:hypothetical protein